jgi:hypothetical protein
MGRRANKAWRTIYVAWTKHMPKKLWRAQFVGMIQRTLSLVVAEQIMDHNVNWKGNLSKLSDTTGTNGQLAKTPNKFMSMLHSVAL